MFEFTIFLIYFFFNYFYLYKNEKNSNNFHHIELNKKGKLFPNFLALPFSLFYPKCKKNTAYLYDRDLDQLDLHVATMRVIIM